MPIWQPRFTDPTGTAVEMTHEGLLDACRAYHRDFYSTDATGGATAPATWSLLGEHTDHSGGVVLSSIAQWAVAVTVSANDYALIRVGIARGDGERGVDKHSISVEEIAKRATIQQATVDAHGRLMAVPVPEGGAAARLGGIAWTMIHRQMLSRDTCGLDITVVSNIPPQAGLGESEAADVAAALALFTEDTSEPPVRARLAEICSQAADTFAQLSPLRARHTVALRGEHGAVSVTDYSDGSVTQAPHPVSKSAGLRAFAVSAPDTCPIDNEPHEPRRRRNFIDEATRAFSVESLRLLPDATTRVVDWLQAAREVTGRQDLPTVEQARNWLNFWEEETLRAQQLAGALRSRRRQDIASLIQTSQHDLICLYGVPTTDEAVAQLCLSRGALSARSASAGITHGVITLIDAPKASNFSADLAEDGLLVVPLGHGNIAQKYF